MAVAHDERVEAAIKNWAPRFLTNGIYYSDFLSTTERIQVWDQWCAEWSRSARVHEEIAEAAEAAGSRITARDAYREAALCYHYAKFLFVNDMAQLREAHDKNVACYAKAAATLQPPAQRVEIPFEGIRMPGYLRKPPGRSRPPVVVIIPGLDSVKEEMYSYEILLLQRGLATLAIDGPGQGEAEFIMNIRSDYEKPIAAVIDYLEGRDDVDAGAVGLIGISLGGYYGPRAAAFEPRVKATIGICGPYNWGECWDLLPSLSRAAFQQRSGARSPEEARERAGQLSLEGVAHHIKSPLLIIHGRLDRLIPPEQAERIVAEAGGPKELWMFEDGNHVCNNIPYKHRPQMSDWLARQLGGSLD